MKTVVNIRVDQELKKELQRLAKTMGISLSALISAVLTKTAREKKVELSGLTENGFTPEQEDKIYCAWKEDETVAVCETAEDTEKFLQTLMDEK